MGPLYVLPIKGLPHSGPLFAEECTKKSRSKNILPIRALCKAFPNGAANGALYKEPLNVNTNKGSTVSVNVLQNFGEDMLH